MHVRKRAQGEQHGVRFFSSRSGIIGIARAPLEVRTAIEQAALGLWGFQERPEFSIVCDAMRGSQAAWRAMLTSLASRATEFTIDDWDSYVETAYRRALNQMTLILERHAPGLGRILETAISKVTQGTADFDRELRTAIQQFVPPGKLGETVELVKRLLPFWFEHYKDDTGMRSLGNFVWEQFTKDFDHIVRQVVPPDMEEFARTRKNDVLSDINKTKVLAVFNILFVLANFYTVLNSKVNAPHESTYVRDAEVPFYPNRRYDGRTVATNISYTPIATVRVIKPHAAHTLSEHLMAQAPQPSSEPGVPPPNSQAGLDAYAWVSVPIGADDSEKELLVDAVNDYGLDLAMLWMHALEQSIPEHERNSRAGQFIQGLIDHQRDMIALARDPSRDSNHFPVWLQYHHESTSLHAIVNQAVDKTARRIRQFTKWSGRGIGIMNAVSDLMKRTGSYRFFMQTPIGLTRSVPTRISSLLSQLLRTVKVNVEPVTGVLVIIGQNLLSALTKRRNWSLLWDTLRFGVAPYASSSALIERYRKHGRLQRAFSRRSVGGLIQEHFRSVQTATVRNTEQIRDIESLRSLESLYLIFTTPSKRDKELVETIGDIIAEKLGADRTTFNAQLQATPKRFVPDVYAELLITAFHLDDDVWLENPDYWRERVIDTVQKFKSEEEIIAYLRRFASNWNPENLENPDTEPIADYVGDIDDENALFKLHNRFYVRLLNQHGFPLREAQSALLLMEQLLINRTIANFLQRTGIGSGVMRPEGFLSSSIITNLVGLEERLVQRGVGRFGEKVAIVRSLYDAFMRGTISLIYAQMFYRTQRAPIRGINTLITLLGVGGYLAGVLSPWTLPLIALSSFFTLGTFFSKLMWASIGAMELFRDLTAYEESVNKLAGVTLLGNSGDQTAIKAHLDLFERVRQYDPNNPASLLSSNEPIPHPSEFTYSPGATRFIIRTGMDNSRYIHFSEPHTMFLLTLLVRPQLLPVLIEQFEELEAQLPSITELQNYLNAYATAFPNSNIRATVQQKTITDPYTQQTYTTYILKVEHGANFANVDYYELGWYKETLQPLIQRMKLIHTQTTNLQRSMDLEIEAAELVLNALIDRQAEFLGLHDPLQANTSALMSDAYIEIVREIDAFLERLDTTLVTPSGTNWDNARKAWAKLQDPEMREEMTPKELDDAAHYVRTLVEKLQLYSARVEAMLSEETLLPYETSIRTESELEIQLSDPYAHEAIANARELAAAYEERVLDPLRTYLLETALIPIQRRNIIGRQARAISSHIFLAPNVVHSNLSAVASLLFRYPYQMMRRNRTDERFTRWENAVLNTMHQSILRAYTPHMITAYLLLLLPALYCNSEKLRELMAYTPFFVDCRSGRYGAIGVQFGEKESVAIRPAYVLDFITRVIYDLQAAFRRARQRPLESEPTSIIQELTRAFTDAMEWYLIRIPPLEQMTVRVLDKLLETYTDYSILPDIIDYGEALITPNESVNDALKLALQGITPIGVQNIYEMFTAYSNANTRGDPWNWLQRDELIQQRLLSEMPTENTRRIWGYPLGAPTLERLLRSAPYAFQSLSIRAVRPYNPLNQIAEDTPVLYAYGARPPRGPIESNVYYEQMPIHLATNSYTSRTQRNRDYTRIMMGIDPFLYTVLDNIPYGQSSFREYVRTHVAPYSALTGTPELIKDFYTKHRADFIDRPYRFMRRSMMFYEWVYNKAPRKPIPLQNYNEWFATTYKANPHTLNGIIRAGAHYALELERQLPVYTPKTNDTKATVLDSYHVFAAAELYRLLLHGIAALDPENRSVNDLILQYHTLGRHIDSSYETKLSAVNVSARAVIKEWITQQFPQDRAYGYEMVLHRALTAAEYIDGYSPSFYVGDTFAMGLFLRHQRTEFLQATQQIPPHEIDAFIQVFGLRRTRRAE